MINIAELLKDCPKGTKLYSTTWGEVELIKADPKEGIEIKPEFGGYYTFNIYGHNILDKSNTGECLLFPSKDTRNWGRFKYCPFKTFDKVVARCGTDNWRGDLFSYYDSDNDYPYSCIGTFYSECLPYNNETAKLIGTNKDINYL